MRARALILLASALVGCGGATPLLHPAQVLPTGEVRAMGGIAARVVVGNLGDALRDATNAAAAAQANQSTPVVDTTYAQGALVAAAMAPDLSPVAGARVGVGGGYEGGIMYTGRGARIDLRRAFNLGHPSAWAISVGLGLDAAFSGRQTNTLTGVDNANLLGFGGDIPVLIGWHSVAGLYYFWVGGRFQYEHDTIQPRNSEAVPPPDESMLPTLSGDRISASGVVGIAIGFRHVHVALEMEAGYTYLWGSFGGVSARVDGVALTPAAGLLWDF
jgi:hypothetical protein